MGLSATAVNGDVWNDALQKVCAVASVYMRHWTHLHVGNRQWKASGDPNLT